MIQFEDSYVCMLGPSRPPGRCARRPPRPRAPGAARPGRPPRPGAARPGRPPRPGAARPGRPPRPGAAPPPAPHGGNAQCSASDRLLFGQCGMKLKSLGTGAMVDAGWRMGAFFYGLHC